MRKLLVGLLGSYLAMPVAGACPWCRPRVQAGIYNAAYPTYMVLVLLPVAVLLVLGVGLFYWDKIRTSLLAIYANR
ncbi:hypothetical protein GO988_20130 [Hymenobacter sp. HMF4947]|uniref:Uncharacterized protein n=1 Tax=Hymenobacter ginkgonis TaxID=2682976 RepID=A0A7K1TJR6_9BACT|nr:hypothetical protein [Hymenobacter ginkgonis]MVN78648.1 hypothetical protein [Hymenobacter ginkgonis]